MSTVHPPRSTKPAPSPSLSTPAAASTALPSDVSAPHSKDLTLSKDLKEGTKAAHSAAESVEFVKQFLQGNVDKDGYRLECVIAFF